MLSELHLLFQLILLKSPFLGLKGEPDTTNLYPLKEGREKAHSTTLRNTFHKFYLLNLQHRKRLYPLVFEISILMYCHSYNNSSFHLCQFWWVSDNQRILKEQINYDNLISLFLSLQTGGFILRWHPRYFNMDFHVVLLHFMKWCVEEKLYLLFITKCIHFMPTN